MVKIKVFLCMLTTLLGVENSLIITESTTVTVNPVEKTIVVHQKNILGVFNTAQDSLAIENEIKLLKSKKPIWSKELASFTKKSLTFTESNNQLNATIKLTYNTSTDLSSFFRIKDNGDFMLLDNPNDIITNDGEIKNNNLYFKSNKPFTYTNVMFQKRLKNMPKSVKKNIKSILPYYKK